MSFVARPGTSPTWADDLPEGWTADWVKWSVAFASTKPTDEDTEKLPYISNEDIASWTGKMLKEAPEPADKEGRVFQRDDVLFNKLRPYLAKVYHADFDGISSGELLNLRSSDRVLPRFLFHVLSSSAFIDTINAETFGTKMPRADWETVGHQPLPLPDLETQRRIAGYLDDKTARIDALIEKKRALLDRLAEKRQALITRAVTRGLNPTAPLKDSGIDWLGKVPAHWEVKRLRHISPKQMVGVVINPSNYVDLDGNIPFIYGANIKPFRIDYEAARKTTHDLAEGIEKSRLTAGDLVVVRVGDPGIAAVVDETGDGANCASVMIVRRGCFNSHWLAACFNSDVGKFNVELVKYGSAQKQFNIDHAVDFWFPVPPSNEQDEIASFLSDHLSAADLHLGKVQDSILLLQEYRAALVTAAVTGKIKALLTDTAPAALMEEA